VSAKNKKNDLSVYKKEEIYQGLRNLQKNRCFTVFYFLEMPLGIASKPSK